MKKTYKSPKALIVELQINKSLLLTMSNNTVLDDNGGWVKEENTTTIGDNNVWDSEW